MRLPLVIGCLSLALLSAGEVKFWDKEDPAAWSPQQTAQFTTASPWAKQVRAILISNDSNMANNAPRSRGRSSRGTGEANAPAALPNWNAVVRWASAKPMRQVLNMQLPTSFAGRYVISVSGLPIAADGAELLEQTTLQVKRGEPIHPELAYQDPADTSTIYFAFLPSMIDPSDGKAAVFNLQASPFEIKARFNLAEMKYRGATAL